MIPSECNRACPSPPVALEDFLAFGRSSAAAACLLLFVAAGARAQSTPRHQDQGPRAGIPAEPAASFAPSIAPMAGVFSFVEPLSDVDSAVVKDAPFSAEVVRQTMQQLADGNRIDWKSTGSIARDSQGRTRRGITLENIGPWVAAGRPPRLEFIDDPVAGRIYTLDRARKVAYIILPGTSAGILVRKPPPEAAIPAGGRFGFSHDTRIRTLGQKTMDGLLVEGTRTTREIPAGQIGNEKPILITTERWYSPHLRTTILLRRDDPRFGITVFELKNIKLSEPPASLFAVPSGYLLRKQPYPSLRRRLRRGPRQTGPGFR